MDSFSSFQNRISQVEKSLCDLNREIFIAGSHLSLLKQHAAKIVKNLSNQDLPIPDCLKEFVQSSEPMLKVDVPETIPDNLKEFESFLCNSSQIFSQNLSKDASKLVSAKNLNEKAESSFQNASGSELLVPNEIYFEKTQQDNGVQESLNVVKCVKSENVFNYSSNSSADHKLRSSTGNNNLVETTSSSPQSSIPFVHCSDHDNSNFQKIKTNSKRGVDCDKSKCEAVQFSNNDNCVTTNVFDDNSEVCDGFSPHSESTLIKPHSTAKFSKKINENVKIHENSNDNLVHSKNGNASAAKKIDIKIMPVELSPKVGDKFEIRVQFIKSPSEFYVHVINENLNSLAELENILKSIPLDRKNWCPTSKYDKTLLMKKIGSYALHYSKCDEVWFRAKITNWFLNYNDNLVSIQLLDYGESKCVNFDSLMLMPEFLKNFPAFAHKCHLHGVYPVYADYKKKGTITWEKEVTEKMKDIIENSKKLKIIITSNDSYHPPDSLPVSLWLEDEGSECVNELLVKSNYAVEAIRDNCVSKTKTPSENSLAIENWNPMKEDYNSYQNLYDLHIDDPAATIYGYVGKDYDRICWHFATKGKCFKGKSCRKDHERYDPLGYTRDKEEIYVNAFNVLPGPFVNKTLNVQVTCISNVNRFYCVMTKFDPSSDEENLPTFQIFMNKNENVHEMRKLLIPPSVGQVVIAQFTEDNLWYRARVLESQPEKDLYAVIFVDYGNKETLPLSRIRAVEGKYLHLPFQAIQCFIYGIDKKPEISIDSSMNYLSKMIGEGNVTIEVVSRLSGDGVNLLVNVFNKNKENIARNLINKGYAISKTEIIPSSEVDELPG